TALVTLHHFTDPLWVWEKGAWETEAIVPLFERFVRKTVDALKEYVNLWVTINEPNVYALTGYANGAFPPGVNNIRQAVPVEANMLRAHVAAYRAIHELQPEARVGYALHFRPMTPKHKWSPLDRLMRNIRYNGVNMAFPSGISTGIMKTPVGNVSIPEAKGTQDYLGVNYYSVEAISFDIRNHYELFTSGSYPEDADFSQNRFIANIPNGLFDTLHWAIRTYPGLPILITENGVEDTNDDMRPRYLAQHIHQMWRAVNFNWPVKGYFHWSLVDNFEWERGWTQRFGLWGLDIDTQKRIRRPSVDLYAEICKENGLSSEMVQKYCPEAFEKIFPS
ncbi:MAG: family 1 glycosylhydrolase, partial [Anaerolineales bacterium]|nr:family 1 glycosylhydrolase [Anaerolineales bacterium]